MPLTAQKQAPAVTFDEIRALVRNDLPSLPAYVSAEGFDGLRNWLAAAQNKAQPSIRHPRLALFASGGDIQAAAATLTPMAQEANADLQVYELGSESADLTEHEAAHALCYGMMAVQPGVDLLAVAALSPSGMAITSDPFDALLKHGTLEIAAIAGAMIAARLARIPVLVEGDGAKAAAALLEALNPGGASHGRDVQDIVAGSAKLPAGGQSALAIALLKVLAKA